MFVVACVEGPKRLRDAGSPSLKRGMSDPLETRPSPPVLARQICSFYRSNGWCVIMEILRKGSTLRVPPFKLLNVIGTDTDRSATYDFPLVFHSNYCPNRSVPEINGDI